MTGYGLKKAGDIIEISDKSWAEYQKNGSATLVSETAEPAKVETKPEAPKEKEKSSVTITDNTNKEKKEITKP